MIPGTSRFRLAEMDLDPILGLAGVVRLPVDALQRLIVNTHEGPDPANLCMQMFYVLHALGQHEFALEMQARALMQRCIYRLAGPASPAIRLLALMAPGDMSDNASFEFLIENSDVRLDLLYLRPGCAVPDVIPDHDIVIVAIGESDRNRGLLAQAEALFDGWPRPALNHPRRILECARERVYQLLRDAPGMVMAPTRRLESAGLHSLGYPVTIRPVDTQGGHGLAKVEDEAQLGAYREGHPDGIHYVADFVDYRSEDGLYRKCRVALIDGKPYVCHLAISESWMVHYLRAGMHLSERKRAEEAAFMEDFESGFGLRHGAAFAAIARKLGLDHVVLDCAETRDGRLLLFEADSRGWIHATDDVDLYPYKPKIMQKAFDAFRTMLVRRSADSLAEDRP